MRGDVVLVVEDDPESQEFMVDVLEALGLVAQTANDAVTAFRFLRQVQPDLVLLDLSLPDLQGEMVADLLQKRTGGTIPFLIVSGTERGRIEAAAKKLRAAGWLRKPVERAQLVNAVTGILGQS